MNWVYMPPIDMEWDEVGSKIGSKDNLGHVASGGNVTIQSYPTKWKAEAKVSSLDEKHIAKVEKVLSAPQKDHVRRIKLPPTVPARNYKNVEYTRDGVYAIVEPVKIEAKSKINFPKYDKTDNDNSYKSTDNDVTRRIKVTKNTKVDKYNKVEQTDHGTYVIVDPVKIDAKPKVEFPKADQVSERKSSENIDVKRRIKVTKNTRVDNYNNVEQTEAGTYVLVDQVKIDAKPKVDFPKPDPQTYLKRKTTTENIEHKFRFF